MSLTKSDYGIATCTVFKTGFETVYFCVFIGVVRRKPTTRQLWDKTSDRWEHDMYREDEQGPKTKEELKVRSSKSTYKSIDNNWY